MEKKPYKKQCKCISEVALVPSIPTQPLLSQATAITGRTQSHGLRELKGHFARNGITSVYHIKLWEEGWWLVKLY